MPRRRRMRRSGRVTRYRSPVATRLPYPSWPVPRERQPRLEDRTHYTLKPKLLIKGTVLKPHSPKRGPMSLQVHRAGFQDALRTPVVTSRLRRFTCTRRRQRRSTLFALKLTGKGAKSPKHFKEASEIKCSKT